ncbi:hypothetical protein PUN28_018012 [Cardiocondyla obscurior]
MEQWNDLLQPHVWASKVRLSYVDELFPDLKDSFYVVLHKNVPGTRHVLDWEGNERSIDEPLTKHDVSGSPLKYSFDNYDLDDTAVIARQNWRREEESFLPLSKVDACNALNKCLQHLDTDGLPILALCDGKDAKQSRIVGAIVSQNWYTTLEAVYTGMRKLGAMRSECQRVIQDHLKQPYTQEQNVKISIFSSIDLFGVKHETIDWDKTVKTDFEGSINVEMHSSSLDLRLSKNILVVQVNAGWKNSPLKDLRDQLFLLIQYLSTIDECKKNIGLQIPIKFTTPYSEKQDVITEQLNLLLNGDLRFQKSDNVKKSNLIDEGNPDIDAKLRERLQNVSLRHDVDFTDLLWEILTKVSTYPQMINCIETVLMDILENKFVPQTNDTNSTRFAKCISNLHRQETISHLLTGSVPLEFVIDMGFEKLIRDYLYILRGVRLVDLYDIRQKLNDTSSGIFNTDNYRNKLVTLAQIHICLECMLLIEENVECPIESLQGLFVHAYKEFISAQSPVQYYTELCSQIYTLTIPLPNALVNELSKINPSIWRASVSSHSVASMLTSTTYYNKIPIFPTNIYSTDDLDVQEEIVYGMHAISSSTKYKKL